MTIEREVFQTQDNEGNIQFYELTPLQKRLIEEIPLLNKQIIIRRCESIPRSLLKWPEYKREMLISELPIIKSLSKKLNVNRSTLVNALNRRNGSRPSLMEMGLVDRLPIAEGFFRNTTYYFYRTCTGEFIIQEIEDEPKMITREELTPGYNDWRKNVLNRDKVCQCCGFDKHLQVHHLFGYKEHPELATDMNNGVTLCKFCHDKYHSVYGLKDINPLDYMNFIERFKVKV